MLSALLATTIVAVGRWVSMAYVLEVVVPLPALLALSLNRVLFKVMTSPVWVTPGFAVRVAVQWVPSTWTRLLKLPSATVNAPAVRLLTVSLKVMVTREVLPLTFSAVLDTTMVAVGATVSMP